MHLPSVKAANDRSMYTNNFPSVFHSLHIRLRHLACRRNEFKSRKGKTSAASLVCQLFPNDLEEYSMLMRVRSANAARSSLHQRRPSTNRCPPCRTVCCCFCRRCRRTFVFSHTAAKPAAKEEEDPRCLAAKPAASCNSRRRRSHDCDLYHHYHHHHLSRRCFCCRRSLPCRRSCRIRSPSARCEAAAPECRNSPDQGRKGALGYAFAAGC